MINSFYKISLDIQDHGSHVSLKAKKGDTGRILKITLVDGGKPYKITSECLAVFVAKKADGTIIYNGCSIIEGNYSHMVKRRTLAVNGKYIRGYCLPDYASKATITNMEDHTMNSPTLKKGSKGDAVKAMQILLIGYGYTCGCCGADGDFGEATQAGLRNFQFDHRLTVDGICGQKTWSKLLGVM